MSHKRVFWTLIRGLFWSLFVFVWSVGISTAQAKIQFDVFPGYEGRYARAGAWYPVAFEIFNDGPSFDGVVELGDDQTGGYTVRIPIELPTNTRKIFTSSLFCPTAGNHFISARLLDSRGKIRDERPGLKLDVATWEGVVLGSMPGVFSGAPAFPDTGRSTDDLISLAPRLSPEFFPDNPVALEALNSLYLNTSTALKLKPPQIEALLSWMHSGGHLIVAVDQAPDLNALSWLRLELPAKLGEVTDIKAGAALEQWVQGKLGTSPSNLEGFRSPVLDATNTPETAETTATTATPITGKRTRKRIQRPAGQEIPETSDAYGLAPLEPGFASRLIPTYSIKVNLGKTLLSVGTNDTVSALIVTHPRDRGRLTLLAFNPEREPIKSWKGRPWFWARMVGLPASYLTPKRPAHFGGAGVDGIYGAMIETRQIRKLPVGALLLLLLVYLLVIGPLDQWWLRKLNRPMLTWITFPTYVVLFSLLIYVIGYKLRAGKAEWTELHVVDVLPRAAMGDSALRGRTYASLYSPGNYSYPVTLQLPGSNLRPESRGLWEPGIISPKRTVITQTQTNLSSELSVDVWTSQLNVFDWQSYSSVPLTGKIQDGGNSIHLENLSDHSMERIWVVANGKLYSLNGLQPHQSADFKLSAKDWLSLGKFLEEHRYAMQTASQLRGQAFGANEKTHIDDWPETAICTSFTGLMGGNDEGGRNYVSPPGLDLSALSHRGDVIVFAWMPDTSLVAPIPRFQTPLFKKHTLLRWVLSPVTPSVPITNPSHE